jgi:hypothetical protein
MLREPRREACTICAATAPGVAFTGWVPWPDVRAFRMVRAVAGR